jgi:hypothetical protein
MLVSRRLSPALAGLVICLLALLGAGPALAGPTVTVRVQGESATLLPRTTVTLGAPEPVSGCPANSVASAINLAVGGNWDHGEANKGGGDFTESILGETHDFTNNSDTWAEWVNYKWGGGVCSDLLNEGDEVLMVADHEPEPLFSPTVWPLVVTSVPSSVQVGVPFTVSVDEVRTPAETFAESGEGTPMPVAGASVSGAGVLAGTSDAGGAATVTVTSPGNITLDATKAGDVPSTSFVVCAHNGDDGTCGASGPSIASGPTTVGPPYSGPYAVVAKAAGVLDGHVYAAGHAPRLLSGTVLTHARVASVGLRLRRSYRGRCFGYNGVSEKFRRAHCGQGGGFFKVATTASFSYLLPAALRRGRYVLDIEATDVAGNHSAVARGTSRIVFYVR